MKTAPPDDPRWAELADVETKLRAAWSDANRLNKRRGELRDALGAPPPRRGRKETDTPAPSAPPAAVPSTPPTVANPAAVAAVMAAHSRACAELRADESSAAVPEVPRRGRGRPAAPRPPAPIVETSKDRDEAIERAAVAIREYLAAGNRSTTAGVAAAVQVPVSIAKLAISKLGRAVERGIDELWKIASPTTQPAKRPYELPPVPSPDRDPDPLASPDASRVVDLVRAWSNLGRAIPVARLALDLSLPIQQVRLVCAADRRLQLDVDGVRYRERKGGAA